MQWCGEGSERFRIARLGYFEPEFNLREGHPGWRSENLLKVQRGDWKPESISFSDMSARAHR